MRIVEGARLARRLRRRFSTLAPIAILETVASERGVLIERHQLGPRVAGLTWEDGGRPVVAINDTHPPERQLFSLAHEMGHVLLGHGAGWLIEQPGEDADNEIERNANAFAAELLMPADRIAKWVAFGLALHQLCENCGVSVEAMSLRLQGLGLWRIVDGRERNGACGGSITRTMPKPRYTSRGNRDTNRPALLPF